VDDAAVPLSGAVWGVLCARRRKVQPATGADQRALAERDAGTGRRPDASRTYVAAQPGLAVLARGACVCA
jgi:hypothetical protein